MPQNKIEIYQDSDGSNQIKVQFDGDTVWLNRNQLSQLFNRDVKTIGKHLTQIFIEGELSKQAVVAKFGTTTTDGKTYQIEHFNLDVIISVGYRVKSREGTQFRIWANRIPKEHLINGYTLNQRRLAPKRTRGSNFKGWHQNFRADRRSA
jgi:hypothetical protein